MPFIDKQKMGRGAPQTVRMALGPCGEASKVAASGSSAEGAARGRRSATGEARSASPNLLLEHFGTDINSGS